MERLSPDKSKLKKFGITMGMAFFIISLFILFKHRQVILTTYIISAIFFIAAFVMPVLLRPVYIFWMKLAFLLSWINTRLILIILFYLIFTPMGIGMRLFGVDLLDRRIEKDKKSYWREKISKKFNPKDYERQF